ncbi:hypothetical protein HELRODRAFT_178431 [Helobdella robusta]|uniref:Uncharacterized protein n=1 Tax=Helobdella robusta TaxID=6412 RepID=T1FD55_HELRO|nr:hypothetical protein HELRODRAFT_178431 [Helobdella robusta]ESN96998.1 hypothetical protein HELRODRAFT_178431 [Helobdella robusta]
MIMIAIIILCHQVSCCQKDPRGSLTAHQSFNVFVTAIYFSIFKLFIVVFNIIFNIVHRSYQCFSDITIKTKRLFFLFIWCNIQANVLQQRYETDAEFALKMRMLSVLAFLDSTDIVEKFERLLGEFPAERVPVIDFFKET